MNHDEKYRAWKERPRPRDVSADFSAEVMRRIYRQAEQRPIVRQQFAALAAGAIVGLARFWLLFSIIFKPELMNFK